MTILVIDSIQVLQYNLWNPWSWTLFLFRLECAYRHIYTHIYTYVQVYLNYSTIMHMYTNKRSLLLLVHRKTHLQSPRGIYMARVR